VEAFFTSILIEGQLDHYFDLGMFNIFWSLVRRLTSKPKLSSSKNIIWNGTYL
jgi:hypothetical protein